MFGRDFVVGGDDVADGGDVVESTPSRAASALCYGISFVSCDSNCKFLPKSIRVGFILLILFFHWWSASPAAIPTVFSLRQ